MKSTILILTLAILSCLLGAQSHWGMALNAQPANDDCANAEVLTGPRTAFFTDLATTDGTAMGGTCDEDGTTAGQDVFNDVWFIYNATASGLLSIGTCDPLTDFDTAIAVYSSTSCPASNASLVGCDDDGPGGICPNFSSILSLPVSSGQSLLIRVGGFANGVTGSGALNVDFIADNYNDCASPGVMLDGTNAIDTSAASGDGSPLDPAVCDVSNGGTEQIYNDVWYTYTATQTGEAVVSTCNTVPFDSRLAIYSNTNCPADPADVIGCNDDGNGCAGFSSIATFDAVQNQSYLIRIGGFGAGDGGAGDVEISYNSGTTNDECAGALTAIEGPNPFDTTFATTDGLEFLSNVCNTQGNNQIENDVWFTYTATQTGNIRMSTCDTPNFDSQLACYNNSSCPADPLDVIACNDDDANCLASGFASTISFGVTMGTEYLVRVGGFNAISGGAGILNIDYVAPSVENLLCTPVNADQADLTWDLPGGVAYTDSIEILVDGMLVDTISGSATSYSYMPGSALPQPVELCVRGNSASLAPSLLTCCSLDCSVLGMDCSFDCTNDTVTISWLANPLTDVVDVYRDGVILMAGLDASTLSFTDADPLTGLVGNSRNYELVLNCTNGQNNAAQCDAIIEVATPAQDLVLALERNDAVGGLIDSAAGLEQALLSAGRSVTVIQTPFLDYGCISNLVMNAENIWILTGSYPVDYKLSTAEGDAIASYAAMGKGIYLESGDHWYFGHNDSDLDLRDGIDHEDPAGADGDDTLTALAGENGFGALNSTYSQDSAGLDYNDQIILATMDDVTSNLPIWRNEDDTMTMEADYIVGVFATHNDSNKMISVSWEFGGYALDPMDPAASDAARQALAEAYLALFAGSGDPKFIRGNCNNDANVNIADAIALLGITFPSGGMPFMPECTDACDANDDGNINIADAIALLGSIFSGGILPAPAGACGLDPTPSGLDCLSPNQVTCP